MVGSGQRAGDEDLHGMLVLAVTTQLPGRVERLSTRGARQRLRQQLVVDVTSG